MKRVILTTIVQFIIVCVLCAAWGYFLATSMFMAVFGSAIIALIVNSIASAVLRSTPKILHPPRNTGANDG